MRAGVEATTLPGTNRTLDQLTYALQQAASHLGHSSECSSVIYSVGDGSDICTCGMPNAYRTISEAINVLSAVTRERDEARETLAQLEPEYDRVYTTLNRVTDQLAAVTRERDNSAVATQEAP